MRISSRGTEALAAAVVDAPRTECALNIETSIPASTRSSRIHRAIVDGETGRCGLMKDKNKFRGSLPVVALSLDVDLMYCLKQATGYNVVSCGKAEMMADAGSWGRKVLVCFNVKMIPSGAER